MKSQEKINKNCFVEKIAIKCIENRNEKRMGEFVALATSYKNYLVTKIEDHR